MKSLVLLLFLTITFTSYGQEAPILQDTTELQPNSLRVLAEVVSADDNMAYLKIESVVGYGRVVTTVLNPGDEIMVRLPGQNKPSQKTKIVADLLEKMDVGAMPSSYILVMFKTVE